MSYMVSVDDITGLVTITFDSGAKNGITEDELLAAIEAAQYDNNSATPTPGTRTISIVSLTDTGGTDPGEDTSTFVDISSSVTIEAPPATGGGGGSTNAAPTLVTPNADATVQAGAALNLTIGDTHFVDPEGTDLNYSITVEGAAAPSWISFDSATGALTANPTSAGQFTVVVTASDGSLTTSDEFELIVTAPAAQNIRGTRGDDRNLIGGDGDDTINGKKGDDRMTGGDGADTFVFSAGHDKVVDFDGTEGDLIDLGKAKGIKDFEDLMSNHVKDTDSGLKITATDGSSMFLKGVDADDLTADMFIF
ncbi:MAG: hypothetical protein EON57_11490 [Alphaproteobacteria bacterium]|nr:MAG: hypothetical protein EON57_11490 [Alphaproteobacteria bacterium]